MNKDTLSAFNSQRLKQTARDNDRWDKTHKDPNQLGYIGSKPGVKDESRDSDSWFTPAIYTDMARKVMNGIDLDPFSSTQANKTVKAKKIFTIDDSGLTQDWCHIGKLKVWMNPPYGRGLMDQAIDKLIEEYYKGSISEAIVLVNNATETQWFQSLVKESSAICLVERRISFYNVDGKNVSGNTRGQVFVYIGQSHLKFKDVFESIGLVFQK